MARVLEALWPVDRVGSATKPNCSINFFFVDSVVVFSCQEHCTVSDLICFARAMEFCFHFFALYCCCCRQLVLGFQSFCIWFELGCLELLSLGDCFIGFGVVFGWICFSSRRLVCHLLVVGPSLPCFFAGRDGSCVAPACCICLQVVHNGSHVCHIICGSGL